MRRGRQKSEGTSSNVRSRERRRARQSARWPLLARGWSGSFLMGRGERLVNGNGVLGDSQSRGLVRRASIRVVLASVRLLNWKRDLRESHVQLSRHHRNPFRSLTSSSTTSQNNGESERIFLQGREMTGAVSAQWEVPGGQWEANRDGDAVQLPARKRSTNCGRSTRQRLF